jgi:AcrR family transcriptional regulator
MATPLGLNLREKGKLERRQRIERAAREVFRERGFDAATTREIAARAGVGNATLFLYARDKTQLLAWVFRDELAAVNESALTPLTGDEPLVDRLERFFRPRYELWARDPRLSRAAVRAALMANTERGEERDGDPIATLWPRLVERIAAVVTMNQRDGAIDPSVDPQVAARLVFDVYSTEVHEWLACPAPSVDDGLLQLRAVLALASRAMQKQPA